jgi:very-short-patch-repair endonuclease
VILWRCGKKRLFKGLEFQSQVIHEIIADFLPQKKGHDPGTGKSFNL